VETRGSREIEELGDAFNSMTRKLQASQQNLAAAERELAWKEMAKQVAHEIRNPLTPMRLAAQHLRHAYHTGGDNLGELVMKITDTILEQVEKLTRISLEFSRFARMPKRTIESVELNSIIEETVRLFRHTGEISIHLEHDEPEYYLNADREELSSVFTNVLRNAVQAIEGEGNIYIRVIEADGITVTVRDTGCGIAEEVLPRIFEPSFSTKTEGMGLGLAIIKKILDDMNASIEIESRLNEGTTVRIVFPAG
jgi:nitrogen fixation/metabolism regulation signal transduction histidine kinase